MRRLLVGVAGAALLLACLPARAATPGTQKGKLQILQEGKPIGTERYEITATDTEITARGDMTFTAGDEKVHQTTDLLLNADLSPRRYDWKMDEPKPTWVRVDFDGSQATIHYPRPDGKEDQQQFTFASPRVAVLDINVFHQFLLLVGLYDLERGGVQEIPVFVPQSVQPGTVQVEMEGVESLPVDGAPQPVRRFSIRSEDNHVLLWVTESGRFVKLTVPQADVEVVPESGSN